MDAIDISQRGPQTVRKRQSSPPSFVLTERDIDLLGLILEYRFLRREQISALIQRHPKRLHRRLSKLERHGCLTTIRYPQQKYVYGLGRAGVQELVEQGRAQPELLGERLRTHELAELFLRHEMMIVDIHVLLTLACREHPARLVEWREGRELHDSVLAEDQRGTNRLPVRPDAFVIFLDTRRPEGANRTSYMLEADRSTTTHTRFQEKFRAYWAYIHGKRYRRKLGVQKIKVLTVTLTEARAKNLSALAHSSLPAPAWNSFRFAPLGRLSGSPDPIGESLLYSPRQVSEELHALVPTPNGLQKVSAVV